MLAWVSLHLSIGTYTALGRSNSRAPLHHPHILLLSTKTRTPMAITTLNHSLTTSKAALRRRDIHSKISHPSRACIINNSRMARQRVTMRITMVLTVAGGEGLTLDYARLWRRVWLVVAVWILVSCKGKWRERDGLEKGKRGGR